MHPHYDDLDVPTCSIARWKTSEGSTATMPAGAVATGQSRRPSLFGVSWRVWVAGEGRDSGGAGQNVSWGSDSSLPRADLRSPTTQLLLFVGRPYRREYRKRSSARNYGRL